MALDQIMETVEAYQAGKKVARVHSGDPSLYGAVAEQARRLRAVDIPYVITPGVSAYTAAAATMGVELTLPTVSQSIILTRRGRHGCQSRNAGELCPDAFNPGTALEIRYLRDIQRRLIPYYGEDYLRVAYRVGWPDEQFIHGTLTIIRDHPEAKITRTAIIFVGPVLVVNPGLCPVRRGLRAHSATSKDEVRRIIFLRAQVHRPCAKPRQLAGKAKRRANVGASQGTIGLFMMVSIAPAGCSAARAPGATVVYTRVATDQDGELTPFRALRVADPDLCQPGHR